MSQKIIKGELLHAFQTVDEFIDDENLSSELRSLNKTLRRYEKANLKHNFKRSFDDYSF